MTSSRVRRASADDGFGVVEIIVSMMLLALLLLALAPVLIQSLRVSARTATIGYASQVVHEQIQAARTASASCDDFKNFLDEPGRLDPVFDARGVEIHLDRVPADSSGMSPCPGGGVQLVEVTATSAITGETLAEAKNAIAVPGW